MLLQYDSIKYDEQTIEALKQKDEKLVIPLYHQMISKLIYEKRKAVIKKPISTYKIKKTLSTNESLSTMGTLYRRISDKTKKQRAFQQLLEKGDLLNV